MAEDDPLLRAPGDRFPMRPHQTTAVSTVDFAGPAKGDESESIDLMAQWATLWARRVWIIAASILGLALAVIYSLMQVPLYRSTATLELTPPTIPILGDTGGGANMVVPQSDYQFLETQYGLMRSQDIARRVVESLNLAGKTGASGTEASREEQIKSLAAGLAGSISVEPVPDSRLVNLTYTADDPQEAARIVNAYAKAYLQSNLDRRYEATESTRQFLKESLEATRTALNDAESKLVAYARSNNLIDIPGSTSEDGQTTGGSSLSGASLSSLNSALAEAQQRRIAAEQRFRQGSAISEVNQSTTALRAEKAKLETEYAEKSNYFQDSYPDMVRLRLSINALDREIRAEGSRASGSVRADYQAALAEEKALRARVQELSGDVLDTRERSIQYNMLQRELDTNRTLYDALLDRYNKVGVASDLDASLATIVDAGRVPGGPYTPNIPLNLIFGLFAGLGLGIALAFVYEFMTDTIKSPDDVRDKLHIALMGVIPKRSRNENVIEQLEDPKSPFSEAYSSLLTTLRFSTNEGIPRSLLITSVRASEGKSTTSFVLATQLAKLGKRVLLIDADMRRPSFLNESSPTTGLSSLLTTTADVAHDHIVKTRADNLWLMPSGPIPPNPSQLLSSPRFKSILQQFETNFDCVIIDAPPSHGLADATLLGAVVSGVLLLVESRRVRRKYALETIAQLRSGHCNLLGACLSKYAGASTKYGYNYNYYSKYGEEGDKIEAHELSPLLLDGEVR
jgi:succinoglycan biosynthesis transport protein ExoP